MKVNGQLAPCVHNFSYSFIPIFMKLYRCLDHALKMCVWFGYNPQINFETFFRNLNLVLFQTFYNESEWTVGTLCAQLLLQFYSDSFKLYRCPDHALKLCVWFGYNPQINFEIFCSQFELSRFSDIFTVKVN